MPLAEQNNNPGDLRFAGQEGATQGKGGFAAFATPEAGIGALLNQVQTNINRTPNENLIDFSSKYAPASDGNNVGQYASNLANQLGVSPMTPISQLSSKVPQFAQAIAHNEDDNTPEQSGLSGIVGKGTGKAISQTAREVSNAVGGPAGIAGIIGGASALGAGALALGGEGIADVAGLGGDIVGAAKGLFGGNNNGSNNSQTSTSQPVSTEPNLLSGTPDYPPAVASAVNNALSTMVGGNNVLQEAKNRGIDDVGAEMAKMGLVPQVDENGNYDKISPTLLINAGNAQDAQSLNETAENMVSQISLADARDAAIAEAKAKMQNSPDLDSTLTHIEKTFAGHSKQHPNQTDKNGRPLSMYQQFINPKTLRQMEVRASEGENWATAPHERSASQHIKTALGKHLSMIAKNEGVKGWDETKRRMETRFLIKKAIKSLPKKAQRDFKKELLHDLVVGAGGALIGKTLGHGLIGGTAGYLLAKRLGNKQYKPLANKKERQELEKRAHQKQKGLISKTSPK
jgi:hypothetical protein